MVATNIGGAEEKLAPRAITFWARSTSTAGRAAQGRGPGGKERLGLRPAARSAGRGERWRSSPKSRSRLCPRRGRWRRTRRGWMRWASPFVWRVSLPRDRASALLAGWNGPSAQQWSGRWSGWVQRRQAPKMFTSAPRRWAGTRCWYRAPTTPPRTRLLPAAQHRRSGPAAAGQGRLTPIIFPGRMYKDL